MKALASSLALCLVVAAAPASAEEGRDPTSMFEIGGGPQIGPANSFWPGLGGEVDAGIRWTPRFGVSLTADMHRSLKVTGGGVGSFHLADESLGVLLRYAIAWPSGEIALGFGAGVRITAVRREDGLEKDGVFYGLDMIRFRVDRAISLAGPVRVGYGYSHAITCTFHTLGDTRPNSGCAATNLFSVRLSVAP